MHHGMAPFSLLQRVKLQIHMLMCKRAVNPSAETEILLPDSSLSFTVAIFQTWLHSLDLAE